jgi:glyoxylase-like metal-dependent hydrolase (beta-lactamase superfamily II)
MLARSYLRRLSTMAPQVARPVVLSGAAVPTSWGYPTSRKPAGVGRPRRVGLMATLPGGSRSRSNGGVAEMRTLREGLHVIEARVDDFEVRSVIVEGRDAVLVWDTLAHPDLMAAAASAVGGRPLTVAYSHADWDHVWGTAALPSCVAIAAHEACAARFLREVPDELAGRRDAEPGRWDAVELRAPTRVFRSTLELDLGDLTVRLEHLPGHTADECVAWIPAWGVLLAGDAIETPLPVVNDAGAVPDWKDALRRWRNAEGLALVIPSHGRIGGREVVDATIAYLDSMLRGAAPTLPPDLDPFYRRTHEDNLRRMVTGGT